MGSSQSHNTNLSDNNDNGPPAPTSPLPPPPSPPRPSASRLNPAPPSWLSYFVPRPTPELTHDHLPPSYAAVEVVTTLLQAKGLPPELIPRILDHARYWPACRRLNRRALTVAAGAPVPRQTTGGAWHMWTSGQEDELRAELQLEDGGLKDRDGEVWYLCSAPLGCVEHDVERPEDVEGYADGSSREEKGKERIEEEEKGGPAGGEDDAETASGWWAREIVVETLSRDQGWSSGDPRCYGTYEQSYSWFELALLRGGKEVPDTRTSIQNNIHAGQYFKAHRNVLGMKHPLVREMKKGDRVVLWARARYPGWRNSVQEAALTLFAAPFPPAV
ncbi:hypothetical protein JCM24511_05671 [Saitozyma sp. JCM 24511]|nr:hypothetical protein JCM24511_05671 [Saitozyma sp. JCM 24511]